MEDVKTGLSPHEVCVCSALVQPPAVGRRRIQSIVMP